MRMIAIHAQTERKRLDRSVRCAEKRRPWARKQRLRGLIRPDPAVCATAGAACGRKSLSSARIQAIFTSNDTPLGECRIPIPPEIFFKRERTGGRLLDPVPLSRAEIDEANAAHANSEAYFQRLFDLRRREPGDDLTTQLVQAEEAGSKLSNEELTANIILLFGAGHETTVNLIGNALLALHRNPDQLELLKSNLSLMPNAIEEFLRYDSSVQLTYHVAMEDVEIGGVKIPQGDNVMCLLGSANHDPAVYPDHPDRLDITRPNVRPLSFGGGIHFCLGAQLARLEAEVALTTLLRRIPNLRIDDVENPKWRPTFVLRGLKELPASW
jgi:cytochrome P450